MNSKLLSLILLLLPVLNLIAQVPPPPPPGGTGGPGGTPGYSPTPIDQYQIGLFVVAVLICFFVMRKFNKKQPEIKN
jgi:hypothetical protein